jgi:hypothetical protein
VVGTSVPNSTSITVFSCWSAAVRWTGARALQERVTESTNMYS